MSTQEIQFELLKTSPSFKDKADDIISTLIANLELWDSMIVDSNNLTKLVNVKDGIWDADTIYLLTHSDTTKVEAMIESWNPNAWEWVIKDDDFLKSVDVDGMVVKIWFK